MHEIKISSINLNGNWIWKIVNISFIEGIVKSLWFIDKNYWKYKLFEAFYLFLNLMNASLKI